ncbi:MAG TPA: DNA/RNA non-specific endonuclease [Allosphingosinicella sp.]|jgi:endonuclease G|nr:DNA/RNA non-specific endonuclease [Allosphingosinicella sp.]
MAYGESLDRLDALLGHTTLRRIIADAHNPSSESARLLGRLNIPPAELEAALSGRMAESIEAREGAGTERSMLLEAIILRLGRPSYLIRGGVVDWASGVAFEAPGLNFEDDVKPAIDLLAGSFYCVGRVNTANHPALDWVGTAWLVDAGDGPLAITNRHVAQEFAALRAGQAVLSYDPRTMLRRGAWVDFVAEHGNPTVAEARVKGIRYLATENRPDVAILELEDNGLASERLSLAGRDAARGDLIATIGFPARDSRNGADAQNDVFGTVYDCKRLAPGLIRQPAAPGEGLLHDASTLGGASGSPLIDVSSGKVVGLHFSGAYLSKNMAVSVASLKDALKGSAVATRALPNSGQTEGRHDGEHAADFFEGRSGYVREFLADGAGIDTPLHGELTVQLPAPPTADLAPIVGRPGEHELRYTHFSVLYHRARRTPCLTAVNIDGAHPQKIVRGDDQWFADLRLERSLQLTQRDFPADFDRGHMVRREDPNWGTRAAAEQADGDTFHYTNAALQHAQLNRSRQRWLGLEEYILRSAKTYGFRASVFSGPVLADCDPVIEGRDDLQVPLAFWKVVVMPSADLPSLHATGYVLGQATFVRALTETFAFGDFNAYQVPISAIARQTGINFHGLEQADPIRHRGEIETATSGAILLQDFDDIVL